MKNYKISPASQILGVAIFTALLVGIVVFFVTIFAPARYRAPVALDRNYDRSAMQSALCVQSVQERYNSIIDLGSRAPGSEGLKKAEELIVKEFEQSGLQVLKQDVDIPTPLSQGGSGTLLVDEESYKIWPFAPNYTQPVAIPEGGITGELFLATESNIRAETDFSDKIAVINAALPTFKDLGFTATQYKSLGFMGIIVTHSDGMDEIPWQQLFTTMVDAKMPINIARFAAEPSILKHIGKRAHLNCLAKWQNARTHNIIGILKAKAPAKDQRSALIIPVTYDAKSILPDVAFGSIQALQLSLQLQILKGILPHKDALRRDVIFVASTGASQSQIGLSRLISTIGNYGKAAHESERLNEDLMENEKHLRMLREIEKLFEAPNFATAGSCAKTDAAIKSLNAETRKFFDSRAGAVMRRSVFNQAERLLLAGIAYRRDPNNLTSPEYAAFRKEKTRYDDLNNMSALPLARALERPLAKKQVFFDEDGNAVSLRDALIAHVKTLIKFHGQREKTIKIDLELQKIFASYDDFLIISPRLHPSLSDQAHENIGYATGVNVSNNGEAANLFNALLNDAIYALKLDDSVSLVPPRGTDFYSTLGQFHLDSNPFAVVSQPAFSVINPRTTAPSSLTPLPLPACTNLASIKMSMQVLGETVTSASRGYGIFTRLPFSSTYSMHGGVFASGIGNSVVPNYAVANTLVASPDTKPFTYTDPYGNYNMPFLTMPVSMWERSKPPESFIFDKDGAITHVKDYGATAQFIYASKKMSTTDAPVNLILYRASPVAVLNIINPQSMKAFTGIDFISRSGLLPFASVCPYKNTTGMMDFIPPGEYFFVTLKAGAPGNDLVAQTRAFCLGVHEKQYEPSGNEIDGAGYLAFDTPFFTDVTLESATSMADLAAKRLKLQKRYGMADDMTLKLDTDANEIIRVTDEAGKAQPFLASLREFRQALSYLILNHPVITKSVSEAVWGILWYMGLLVPFIFFFEKLLFGFTDIRKQLMAEGAIFLVVFALLRILHPAFHMIRSSAMILLGFVIIIVVGSVTVVLSAKFQENLDSLRKSQGSIKGVAGNKVGIIMTAFMLGLNNMHKRKVRTGLTCATLVLMTFVMICFTSVQSNIVEKERAIGRAAYQGILVREKQFRPITTAEIDALNASYGENYSVNVREAIVGHVNRWENKTELPNFRVVYGEGDKAVQRIAKAGLGFNYTEPLASQIKLLTTNGWFTAQQAASTHEPYPVIISDSMAEQLGIFPEDVNSSQPAVTISGVKFFVHGIFDSTEFANVKDIDGEDFLPFDIEALTNPQMLETGMVLAESTDPRVMASDIILGLVSQLPTASTLDTRVVSAVVDMGGATLKVAREEVKAYLIQTGRDTNYGLDGTAFNGRQARVRSMAGMADLLIPLLIAALTVLNTMKGSVYERRDEIFVYNAVGIAPRYVFFMFVAEALVYSVVGAVLGYILSQGTGRILTALNWTGGLNMNFTSLSTIYASLAIAAATLASTYFPARSAMEIAKPTEDAGWTLPKPTDDDTLTIVLPFTFTHFDRIAVLAFFHQYFENHGEGSAGAFFSAQPMLKLADHTDPLANDAYIPCLDVQVWLKPFDLGVSQRITIELGSDPDTGEFISVMKLRRVTGTRDAWLRLNKPLVALIRRHFLHWRAVPADAKGELFAKAEELLREGVIS